MTKKSFIVLFSILLLGFADACEDKYVSEPQAAQNYLDNRVELTVSGEIIYDEYETGRIHLSVIEEYSFSYTPGAQIGELMLDEPGQYEITLDDVLVTGPYRTLFFIVTIETDSGACIGGGVIGITPPEDPDASEMGMSNKNIELKKDDCPMLL